MADLLKAKYLSEPLKAKMSEYACFCDECERSQSATECDRGLRQKRHTANVGPIAILAFTSDFFDATLRPCMEVSKRHSQTSCASQKRRPQGSQLFWHGRILDLSKHLSVQSNSGF
ncbi:uncharacterized protein RSE6_13879 [Rhynchosporium secalis]|uniref:Uncharacterized protein n=1 Tax=Rhynchosporium secalis TaxID=38038 RepID=A0A1E1MTY8_RHYSE|nr:uncharacterized protein RSE6_13879 [Rhynchosporium secalis]